MKRLILIALLAIGAGTPPQPTVTLSFQPSASVLLVSTNIITAPDAYVIWATTNVALPASQWAYVTNVPATFTTPLSSNYLATTNFVLPPGTYPWPGPVFFSAQYTNGQGGVSPFSNLAGLQFGQSQANLTRISVGP